MIGFKSESSLVSVGSVTINSYDSADSQFDITEAQENFTVDSNTGDSTYGMAQDTLASDSNGNQTYDGTQVYTYDGWNRLKNVSHGYRDSAGALHQGQTMETMTYDARGRRTVKSVNTGPWACTYHYYYDGNHQLEQRSGSNAPIRQNVWGIDYVDDLVQTSLNSSPYTKNSCDVQYWACQDANWNVIGVVNSSGVVQERYEYTPYGQRQVYYSAGSNDPLCYSPTAASERFVASGTTEPWGICEFGHQGLMHDEESGLVYDRARYLSPMLGRFLGRDPLGYTDAYNLYLYEKSLPNRLLDSSGKCKECFVDELKFEPTEVKATWDGGDMGTVGVTFNVKFKWHVAEDGTQAGFSPCRLLWYEYGNDAVDESTGGVGNGIPADAWARVDNRDDAQKMFESLSSADFSKNGELTITDRPGGGARDASHYRWWAIKATSSGRGGGAKRIFGYLYYRYGMEHVEGEFKQVGSIPTGNPPDIYSPGPPTGF